MVHWRILLHQFCFHFWVSFSFQRHWKLYDNQKWGQTAKRICKCASIVFKRSCLIQYMLFSSTHIHTSTQLFGPQLVLSMLQHARLNPAGVTSATKQIATNTHSKQASRQLDVQHTFSGDLPAPFCHSKFAASLKHQYVIESECTRQRFASFSARAPLPTPHLIPIAHQLVPVHLQFNQCLWVHSPHLIGSQGKN